jgi:hypothetical protein
MSFDGVNDYGQMYATKAMPRTTFDIQFWMNISSDPTGDGVVEKWIFETSNPARIFANNAGNLLTWVVQDTTAKSFYTQVDITPNQWIYVHAAFDQGSQLLEVFNANGSRIGYSTNTTDAAMLYNYTPRPYLGGFGTARYFKGAIDDVMISSAVIPVPEPATIALLSLGGLLISRKVK